MEAPSATYRAYKFARDFVALLGVAAASTWPHGTQAQQFERTRLIGVLSGQAESDPESQRRSVMFREGLREAGWIEGRNIRIEFRWADGDAKRMQAYAEELVSLNRTHCYAPVLQP